MSNRQKLRKTIFITVPIMLLGILGLAILSEFFPHSIFYNNTVITINFVILSVCLIYLSNTIVNCQYGINFTESAYELKFDNIESLTSHIETTLASEAFTACPKIKTDDKTELTIYIKPIDRERLDIVLFIATEKLTKKGYQSLSAEVLQLLSEHYPSFNLTAPHIITPIIVFLENTDIVNHILQQRLILPHKNQKHLNKNKFTYNENPYHYDNIHSFHSPVAISFITKMVRLPIFISNNPKRHLQCTRAAVLSMLKVPIEPDNITL